MRNFHGVLLGSLLLWSTSCWSCGYPAQGQNDGLFDIVVDIVTAPCRLLAECFSDQPFSSPHGCQAQATCKVVCVPKCAPVCRPPKPPRGGDQSLSYGTRPSQIVTPVGKTSTKTVAPQYVPRPETRPKLSAPSSAARPELPRKEEPAPRISDIPEPKMQPPLPRVQQPAVSQTRPGPPEETPDLVREIERSITREITGGREDPATSVTVKPIRPPALQADPPATASKGPESEVPPRPDSTGKKQRDDTGAPLSSQPEPRLKTEITQPRQDTTKPEASPVAEPMDRKGKEPPAKPTAKHKKTNTEAPCGPVYPVPWCYPPPVCR